MYPDGADCYSWWAATPEEERDALAGLAVLLAEHPDLPVVTWAGNSADVPRLLTAADRHELPDLADAITDRHLDAYVWMQRNVRLPILGAVYIPGWYARSSRKSEMALRLSGGCSQ